MDVLGRYPNGQCGECCRQKAMHFKRGHDRDPIHRGAVTLGQRLAALGLLRSRQRPANGKHIPPAYLRGSVDQRLALLQGLMDTDGHIDPRGRCEFTTVLPRLANGVSELLGTLGIKHTVQLKEAFAVIDGERRRGRPAYRFSTSEFIRFRFTPGTLIAL
jgi:intein/homing endonuclease